MFLLKYLQIPYAKNTDLYIQLTFRWLPQQNKICQNKILISIPKPNNSDPQSSSEGFWLPRSWVFPTSHMRERLPFHNYPVLRVGLDSCFCGPNGRRKKIKTKTLEEY